MNLDAGQLELLADSLVESHDQLMEELVGMRKRHRLTQEIVAERMGVSQPTVAAFERYDANPTLSTVRRYALAVGASVTHTIEDHCCRNSEQRFAEVISDKASGAMWAVGRPLDWSWSGGAFVVDAHVGS